MQTKLLLLAAAPAALAQLTPVANLQPRQTASETDDGSDLCVTALLEVYSIVQDIATPTDPGFDSYTASAFAVTQTQTDACSLISAAPASLQSAILSYRSAVASAFHEHPDVVSTLSSCAAQQTISGADQLAQLANLPSCTGTGASISTSGSGSATTSASTTAGTTAGTSAGTNTGTSSHNAAPRETGMVAMGLAAAAVAGMVGML